MQVSKFIQPSLFAGIALLALGWRRNRQTAVAEAVEAREDLEPKLAAERD